MRVIISLLLLALTTAGCSEKTEPVASTDAKPNAAASGQTATPQSQDQLKRFEAVLREHVPVLASDKFGGRAPATEGEELTVNYLRDQFAALGLQPGNTADAMPSWFQQVPVTQITINPHITLDVSGADGFSRKLAYKTEMMVGTTQQIPQTGIDQSELVFVGYGIVAPEYQWNDYAGLDVKGKTVVIMVNDPGYATKDEALFKGNTMTYYGRWTYKYEEAARQGAAGAIIIHEEGAAGYPWEVVSGSWSGPQITLATENKNRDRCNIEGWIPTAVAKDLFNAAGLDYDKLTASASKPGFSASPMALNASVTLEAQLRNSASRNVLALIPGSEHPEEAILYSAHWDHLGTDPSLEGDQIYNGALDNATGSAGLLALAEAYMKAPQPPKRSILFIATTAEESGLLGSLYYANHPVFDPALTVAAMNMDSLAILGPMRDVTVIGFGSSELEEYLQVEASKQDRVLVQESTPEKGYFFRSDHFNLAKIGIPALYAKSGEDHLEKGIEWTRQQAANYISTRYHKPADEYDPNWDLRGAALDLQLYFRIGYRLSLEDTWPQWYEGSEFKARRDADRPPRSQPQ